MATMNEQQLQCERAAVLLDVWGTGNNPEVFQGRWSIEGAPEWATELEHFEDAITVLDSGSVPYGAPKPIDGYAIVAVYNVGECACPWCEMAGEGLGEFPGEDPDREPCALCDGDLYLSAGYDLQVVMVPRWTVKVDGKPETSISVDGEWYEGRSALAAVLCNARAEMAAITHHGAHCWEVDGVGFELVDRLDPDTGWVREGVV